MIISSSMRLVLASVSVLAGFYFCFIVFGELDLVQRVTSEDHIVENLTVIAFFLGLISAIYAIVRRRHVFISSIWLVLCVVFIGEETSWFQRAVGYSVPAIEQRNSQQEFNFHNLEIFHGSEQRKIISPDGTMRFGWSQFMTSQSLFRIGFFAYFLVLPLMLFLPWVRRMGERLDFPAFRSWHLFTFWALIALTVPITLLIDPDRRLAIAESRELIYALTIGLYVAGFAFGTRTTVDRIKSCCGPQHGRGCAGVTDAAKPANSNSRQ